ncbi:MAG: DNA polymerase III subunit gamma/tau [Prevotellaceae bacterium]|jgi:DNA polymerase-3 subunit gamma/tau|nr:DNA polymerase III subunit gamma/tau [Prevotellaceae bacterium]
MGDFIVSARKYRPSTFTSVIGQKSLTETLKNSVRTGRLAQAYLFCGPRGVGKTTCARIFAKTINCFNPTSDFEACNECESCRSFNENRSYNIHELDAASNNGVDDIRTLTEEVRIPPQIGKYKVYIIDEVHMLSSAAFNAFLKTLEEPPAYAKFILATTEKHKIIPTILSRCQIFDFNRISIKDAIEYLQYVANQEHITVETNALNVIAQKADGGMRDALSIFDQIVSFNGNHITYQGVIDNLNVLDSEYYFRLTDAFLRCDISASLLIFNEILGKGFDGNHFITGLAAHFRDLLVSKDPQTVQLLDVGAEIGEKYKVQAQQASAMFLINSLNISNECDLSYRESRNKRLLVELSLIKICQLLDEKKKQLNELEIPPLKPINQDKSPVNQRDTAIVQTVSPTTQQAAAPQKSSENQSRLTSISISQGMPPAAPAAPQTYPETPTTAQTAENQSVEAGSLENAWKEFAQTIPEEVRMVNFINANIPVRIAENEFEIVVANQLLEKEISALLPAILDFLGKKLEISDIKFRVKVDENIEHQHVMTPEEHFKAWTSKNPALLKLQQSLELEIN